jgi:hypothetical protein
MSATEAKTKTSKEADEKFRKAVAMMSDYETNWCHPKYRVSNNGRAETVLERMEVAAMKDKSSSAILNRLKEETVHVREVLTPLLRCILIPISS